MEEKEYLREELDFYYANSAKKLNQVVDKIFYKKYGGTTGRDMAEFYSVANDVLTDIWLKKRYDPTKGDFGGFLYGSLDLAVIDEFKRQTRDKRCTKIEIQVEEADGTVVKKRVPISDIRMDAPIGEDGTGTISDLLSSDFNLENELSEDICFSFDGKTKEYLETLSTKQKKIALLIMKGYLPIEIKEDLEITEKMYRDSWKLMNSYEKKRILYAENNILEESKMNEAVLVEDVSETYKNTSYSIESISKQLQKKRIRDDHILQRYSGLWRGFAKSELISCVLRGKSLTQIIISEEIKNGLRMQWLIDGKQRCTTLDDFLHDGFSISKNIKNYNIRYQTTKTDESGNETLNEDGFTEMEYKEFDIRGKKFSQLPEELRDIFKDRQIPVLYNTNCTKKDIAEDIARFNRSRPMNKAQNGWLSLEESFAELVDNISKMQFFQSDFNGSKYTPNDLESSGIRRVIVEGIIASDFIDDFCGFEKMCEFLSDEASDSNFTDFYALIERLTLICNDDVAKLFDTKDSFLWFGLFSRFVNLGLEDGRFVDFMVELNNSLHSKKVNGISYDECCVDKETGKSRPTKDKYIVIPKMEVLVALMNEFLHINIEETHLGCEKDITNISIASDTLEKINLLDFVKENVNSEVTVSDITDYEEDLDKFTFDVDNSSRLLDGQNHNSLIGVIGYSYKEDIFLDNWIVEYFGRNSTYISDQKQNYIHMKEDLDNYIRNTKDIHEQKTA